ncbi:MAG: hypothetical protein ACYCYF_07660 [Anaerolineae bacterium]
MLYPDKPTLTQTETEFLLFIHPEIKERAKVIRGYRWDPERRCWVYPRTKQVWDALVSEFGEELGKASRVKAGSVEPAPSFASLQERIEELEQENAGLRQALSDSVDVIVDADLDRAATEQAELVRQRDEARSQLTAARALYEAQIADLQRETRAAQAQRASVEDELGGARESLARLQAQLVERSRGSSLEAQLKGMAMEATGNDSGFTAVLDTLEISDNLALKAGRLLEGQLRALLKVPERDRTLDLYDLIQQAADYELLPRDAIDMAHLIRRQRNVIAHAEAYEKTYQARSVLCLFAIALLWPELPE